MVAGLPDDHELLRMTNRQEPQNNLIQQAEHRSVGTDAERQRQYSNDGEKRTPPKTAESIAQVLADLFQPQQAPGLPGFFVEKGDIAEKTHRGMASLLRAHSSGDVFGDLLIYVKAKLIVQLPHQTIATEEGLQAHPQLSEPVHFCLASKSTQRQDRLRRIGGSSWRPLFPVERAPQRLT